MKDSHPTPLLISDPATRPFVERDYELVLERLIDYGIDPAECGHGDAFIKRNIPHCPLARCAYLITKGELWPGPFRSVQTIVNSALRTTFAQTNHFALWWDEYGHLDFSKPDLVKKWIASYKERLYNVRRILPVQA